MDTVRQLKVSRLLQKELSVYFQHESINYIPGGILTVTAVRISPDLGSARVFLSVFPSDKGEKTVSLVNEHTKSIRFHLGKILRYQLRIIPDLHFFVDDSLDYAEKIDNLLG